MLSIPTAPFDVNQVKNEVKQYEYLLSRRPTTHAAAQLASIYFTIGEIEKALPLAEMAYKRDPSNPIIAVNYGLILKDAGRHEESAYVMQDAYYTNPEDQFIKLAYAEALLKCGLWTQAWPIYDNSRPTQRGAAEFVGVPLGVKEWQDEIIKPGEKLLVINEGGSGDRFTYPRWLKELDKRGIDWVFYTFDELRPFYERIFPKEKLVSDDEDMKADYWTTAFALPARLNATPNTVPPPLLYTPDPERRKKLVLKKPDGVPVYGICWKAAEMHQGGKTVRSMSEGQMMRLVTSTAYRVSWVNLQFGVKAPYPISNLPINDWEDTASIIDQLDAVVTVDTGVMHLAGGMNKPMYVLLSGNSCWKFLKKGPHCVFFPSATLIRNEGFGFDNAIDQLVAKIRG